MRQTRSADYILPRHAAKQASLALPFTTLVQDVGNTSGRLLWLATWLMSAAHLPL